MTSTLEDLCYQNLAQTMMNAPPLLQEMIAGKTSEKMKKNIADEVKEQVRPDVYHEVELILPDLIPEIMNDIITSMTQSNTMRTDFYGKYPNTPRYIITTAVRSAEEAVNVMENRYVRPEFHSSSINFEVENGNGDWYYDTDSDTDDE